MLAIKHLGNRKLAGEPRINKTIDFYNYGNWAYGKVSE